MLRGEKPSFNKLVRIPVNGVELEGALVVPPAARGIVLFAHGSGSSRHSPRNNFVAETLRAAGIGTLLMDLLTKQEDTIHQTRFDIDLLSWRLERATHLFEEPGTLQEVARLAAAWFRRHLGAQRAADRTVERKASV